VRVANLPSIAVVAMLGMLLIALGLDAGAELRAPMTVAIIGGPLPSTGRGRGSRHWARRSHRHPPRPAGVKLSLHRRLRHHPGRTCPNGRRACRGDD
jgi:hypothetical protein